MRFHCLGPGSIGSLVCFHIKRCSPHQVRLHVRRRQPQHRFAFPSSRPNDTSTPPFSIQLAGVTHDGGYATETAEPFELEVSRKPAQDPIDALLVTTKAQHIVPAVTTVLPRLSKDSTVILLHNGLGVLEELLQLCFPDASQRPSFICAHTSHGVHRSEQPALPRGSHGCFVHSGIGDLPFAVLPSEGVRSALRDLAKREWHWPSPAVTDELPSSSSGAHHTALVDEIARSFRLSEDENPLLNLSIDTVAPSVVSHLPFLPPHTASLHTTISTLLSPPIQSRLHTKWVPLPTYRLQSMAKLAVNAAANVLTGVIGCRNGMLVDSATGRRIMERVTDETSRVYAAAIMRDPSLRGKAALPDPSTASGAPMLPPAHPLSTVSLMDRVNHVVHMTGANISSTLADVLNIPKERDRKARDEARLRLHSLDGSSAGDVAKAVENAPVPVSRAPADLTEVAHLNGYLCRLGREVGVATPVNDTLVDLIALKSEHVWATAPRDKRK